MWSRNSVFHDTRLDDGHADVVLVDLAPQRFGKRNDAEFARRVTGCSGLAMRPAVDEILTMWPPPRARMPAAAACDDTIGASTLSSSIPTPVVGVCAIDRRQQHYTGIVDQDVETSEVPLGLGDDALILVLAQQIGGQDQDFRACAGQLRAPIPRDVRAAVPQSRPLHRRRPILAP
jgi:hypothetical protein